MIIVLLTSKSSNFKFLKYIFVYLFKKFMLLFLFFLNMSDADIMIAGNVLLSRVHATK